MLNSSPVWVLLRKDFGRLKWLFLALLLLSVSAVFLYGAAMMRNESILSFFVLSSIYAYPILPIIALLLGHQLIVQEYYGHTQRYIESLPVSRTTVGATKFMFGYAMLLALSLTVWSYAHYQTSQHQEISDAYAGLMLLKLSLYVLCLWSIAFTFSLLGRFRIPLLMLCCFLLVSLGRFSDFEIDRFGPLALVNKDLFAEDGEVPWRLLLETLAISSVFVIFSRLLISTRDGSLVEKLATPMSLTEKAFLTALMLASTLGYFTIDQPETEVEPSLGDRYVLRNKRLEIAYLEPSFKTDAVAVSADLTPRLKALHALFNTAANDDSEDLFKIRLSLSPARQAKNYHTEAASKKYGLVIGVNFKQTAAWPVEFFSAFVIHEYLVAFTQNRSTLEPFHYLMDGFSYWWTLRYDRQVNDNRGKRGNAPVEAPLLLALYASKIVSVDTRTLNQWDKTAETLGDNLNMALAYSAWRTIESSAGFDAATALAKNEFSRVISGNINDWIYDQINPLPQRFETATGLNYNDFITKWQNDIYAISTNTDYKNALAKLPQGKLRLITETTREGFSNTVLEYLSDKPMNGHSECEVQHAIIPGLDLPYYELDLRKEDVNPQYGVTKLRHLIDADYPPGSRVFASLECRFEGFELPIRLGALRTDLAERQP